MTENNFSFTPMANEDISIHIGSVPGVAAESGAPVASASPVSAQQPEAESIFGEIPAVPTQEAVDGILFDFNDGIRILFPQNKKEYHVVFSDSDTGVILFSQDTVPGAFITSVKKFYICFQLAIYEKGGKEPLFTHDFDARDKEVMIQIPVGTLGDSIGWFSYVERFQRKHQCRLICVMNQWIIDIVKNQYPDIVFITPAQTKNYKPYACYHMGLFFRGDVDHQPIDFLGGVGIADRRTDGVFLVLAEVDRDVADILFDSRNIVGTVTVIQSDCWRGTAPAAGDIDRNVRYREILDHFFIFQKNSLHLKMANFSSLKRRSIFTSRKILREKLELHSASKKSLNIAKMVEKRFELPVSTHDLAYEKIRLADCHKTLIFSDKSENPHARVTGVHKFLTLTPPLVLVDNHGADHQEMKPL